MLQEGKIHCMLYVYNKIQASVANVSHTHDGKQSHLQNKIYKKL
jgi:hypothetical protein